jgi:hypothetical protein
MNNIKKLLFTFFGTTLMSLPAHATWIRFLGWCMNCGATPRTPCSLPRAATYSSLLKKYIALFCIPSWRVPEVLIGRAVSPRSPAWLTWRMDAKSRGLSAVNQFCIWPVLLYWVTLPTFGYQSINQSTQVLGLLLPALINNDQRSPRLLLYSHNWIFL